MASRRKLLSTAGALMLAGTSLMRPGSVNAAKSYPSRAIGVIIPVGAGGAADIVSRLLTQSLGQQLGQSFFVDNRPGAGGISAIKVVSKAAPDGYTLVLIGSGNALTQSLYKVKPYDILKDLAPISRIAKADVAILTGKNSRYQNLQDFLRAAKEHPDKSTIGITLFGTGQHLTAELLKEAGKLNVPIVPYKTSGALYVALSQGEVDVGVDLVPAVLSHVRTGDMRPLAVAGGSRSEFLSATPTLKELGLTKYEFASTMQFAAPAGTPEPVIALLNTEIQKALAKPEVQQHLQKLGFTPVGGTVAQARAAFEAELKTTREVIERAGIALQ